ncbi:MAG TPA: SPOR domain-containing protein [Bacteroidales bacterium]|nr:SPOR domain-containing protein [Bacteroidales bacterium]
MDDKIVSLLNNNLRVIIPDFGAFIIRQQEPIVVVFNEMLRNNDGLLLDYIIKTENVEPEIADQLLADYTNHAQRILDSGNTLTIRGLGDLHKDRFGKLVFSQEIRGTEADARLHETVTAKEIQSPVVSPVIITPAAKAEENDDFPEFWQTVFSKPVINWILLIIALNLIVIFVFVIRENKSHTVKKQAAPAVIEQTVLDRLADSVRSAAADTTLVYQSPPSEDTKESATPGVEADIRYFIVAGCFRDEINADDMVESLKKLGYKAEKFGKIGDLYAVSFASFNNKDEAVNELARIRKQHHPEAWMTRF